MAQAASLIQDAIVYLQQNKPKIAIKRLKQALKRQPDNFDALHLMGCALVTAGDDERALGYLQKAVEQNGKNPNALYNLGGAYLRLGHFEAAVDALRGAVAVNPNDPETHCDIGDALHHLQRFEESMEHYRTAVRLDSRFSRAYNNLGWLLNDMGNYEDAITSCRRALALRPNYEHAHLNIGNAQKNLGRIDEAVASYRKALAIDPRSVAAYKNLSDLYEETNDLKRADDTIRKALELSPDDPGVKISRAVILKRQGNMEEAIRTLEALAAQALSGSLAAQTHNELGKLHDRNNDCERAFHHFSKANELQAKSGTADLVEKETFLSEVVRSASTVTSDWVASWSVGANGGPENDPAFIVGFPRSGTTLLDQLLDSHPAIQVMEEREVLPDLALQVAKDFGDYPSCLADFRESDLERLRERYFQRVDRYIDRRSDTLLVDKLPLNICHTPLIARLFQGAKIILAMRHPCDVVLSNFMQRWGINVAMANFFSLPDAAHAYAQVMSLWQKCTRLLPLDYHMVRYEALVDDLPSETRRMLDFLRVEWDDAVLDYTDHAKKRAHIRTPSYQTVTEPIYGRAKYRWKRYADKLEPTIKDLRSFIEAFGYGEAT